MRVDNISGVRLAEQGSDVVRLIRDEGHDIAAAKEAPELRLPRGTTYLRDDGGGRGGNGADLESHPMVGPHLSLVALGGDEHAGVVDDAHAERG